MSSVLFSQWTSFHIYFDGSVYGAESDTILRTIVTAIVTQARAQGILLSYFFVRYGEGGAHVRLRMHVSDDHVPRIVGILDKCLGPSPKGIDGAAMELSTLTSHIDERHSSLVGARGQISRIEAVPYVPELDRYGGELAMPIAHIIAESSSDLALGLLSREARVALSTRVTIAFCVFLLVLREFSPLLRDAVLTATRHSDGYSRLLARSLSSVNLEDEALTLQRIRLCHYQSFQNQHTTLSKMTSALWEHGVSVLEDELLAQFAGTLSRGALELKKLFDSRALRFGPQQLTDWSSASSYLATSYMHLACNRIGISIREEAHVAGLVEQSLRGLDR